MTPVEEIHNVLIGWDFKAQHGRSKKYIGGMKIGETVFPLEISQIDESFIDLPKIVLKKIPPDLTGPFPHMSPKGELCYLDREGVFLDRYRPAQTMNLIMRRAQSLLESYIHPERFPSEFADEFVAYWNGEIHCYVLSKGKKALSRFFKRKDISGNEGLEIAVGSTDDELDCWATKRNSIEKNSKTNSAVIVSMKKRPLIPLETAWPPANLKEFHEWLDSVDQGAATSLVQQLSTSARQNAVIPIIVLSPDSLFGVLVKYSSKFRVGYRKPGARLKNLVLSKRGIDLFYRVYVSDASMDHVASRAQESGSLKDKKIAQIGCGSVGGYAASLLVQCGAGQGKGKLDLYDGDVFTTDNMGRHILGTGYLGEYKSTAMKHYLENHGSTTSTSINAFKGWEFNNKNVFRKYDLIIDATGDQIFATTLSHHLHRLGKPPVVIHGWIDAGGLAARALTDDGKKACYRCLSVVKNGILDERFSLISAKDRDKIPKVRRRCGASYQPYASNASVTAAGLIQDLALACSRGNPGPRFRHISLSNLISRIKYSDPERLDKCPCCQKTS